MATASTLYRYAARELAGREVSIQVSVHGCHRGSVMAWQRVAGPPKPSCYGEPVYPTRCLFDIGTRTSGWGGGNHDITARELGRLVIEAMTG